jgi:signal transduction histidine kinase
VLRNRSSKLSVCALPLLDARGEVIEWFGAASDVTARKHADNDGNRIGAYQFVYDVTDRLHDLERLRHAEEALRHAQKLESIGQLTGGVAHGINNLLAVFANGLQLLERNVGPEQRQRVFDGMRRAIARGTGLTHHLLAFSRRRPVNPECIDLAAQIKVMREILDRSLRGDIAVDMQLQAGLWPVEVDTGELDCPFSIFA